MNGENKWPVVDKDGYCQSYQRNGRWQNEWRKNKPCTLSILYQFKTTKNNNGAQEDSEIDKHLPIVTPYWLNESCLDTQNLKPLTEFSGIRATWIGHATVLAEIDGFCILFDPIFGVHCGPDFVPKRFVFKRYRKPPCTIDDLPNNLNAVAISHTHYDHLEKSSIIHLNKKYGSNIDWYVPKGSGLFFRQLEVPSDFIHEMVWWEETELNGASIIFTPTNHYSSRSLRDENIALWGSFAILGKYGNRFWFGGDTAYSDVFKQIGEKLGPFQLSAIPIGCYAPREALKYNHVDPTEAINIHSDIRSEMSLGMHWGTFKTNATEFYLEPKYKIEQARLEHGKNDEGEDKLKFYTISIGETLEGTSTK